MCRWLPMAELDDAHKAGRIERRAALGAIAVVVADAHRAAGRATVEVDGTIDARLGLFLDLLHDLKPLLQQATGLERLERLFERQLERARRLSLRLGQRLVGARGRCAQGHATARTEAGVVAVAPATVLADDHAFTLCTR